MKKLSLALVSLLILQACEPAYAGLPPGRAKGQADTGYTTTFNIQAPKSQVTRLNSTTALLETGNTNELANPGAEGGVAAWTASTSGHFTTDASSGNVDDGLASFEWSPTASGETVTSGFITLTSGGGLAGKAGVVTCDFKSANGIQSHVLEGWDGTNAIEPVTLAPTAGSYGRGTVSLNFPISGVIALRLVSGAADTLRFDKCYLGAAEGSPFAVQGYAGSNWLSYTPVFSSAWGTVTGINIFHRRVGDTECVRGNFTTGSVTVGGTLQLGLPAGESIDASKGTPGANSDVFGLLQRNANNTSVQLTGVTWNDPTNIRFIQGTGSNLSYITGSGVGSYEEEFITPTCVPIAGWDANIQVAPSTTFNISSYLAAGTNVTTTPAALGEYRTRYRASALSGALTDSAPTVPPTVADGMRIYGNAPYNSAGTAGQVEAWDVFVGRGKHVTWNFYSAAGKTGPLDAKYFVANTAETGASTAYDPTTGILSIDASFIFSSTNSVRALGTGPGTLAVITDGYWDATVSDNALAVGMDSQQMISSSKNWRTESVAFGGTTEPSNCTSAPCTIYRSTAAVAGVDWTGVGEYTENFIAGTFSAPPICVVTSNQGGGALLEMVGVPTATSVTLNSRGSTGGTLVNDSGNVICVGPR